MIDRRRFLASLAAAALPATAFPTAARTANASTPLGALRPDPQGILDLPAGFTLAVVSRVGDLMHDGLRVPGRHDGIHRGRRPGRAGLQSRAQPHATLDERLRRRF